MAHQKHTKTRECRYGVEERPTDKTRLGEGRHAAYKQVVVVVKRKGPVDAPDLDAG